MQLEPPAHAEPPEVPKKPNPIDVALEALVDVARDPSANGMERVQAASLLLANRELIAIERLNRKAEAAEEAAGEWDALWLEARERADADPYHVYGVTEAEDPDDRRISGPWDPEDDAVEAQTLEYAAIAIDWDDVASGLYMKSLRKFRDARMVEAAPFDVTVLGMEDL